MTSQNKETIAARRAAIRRVRMGLEARIQERLAYACGATVFQPLEAGGSLHALSSNRELGVIVERRSGTQEPAKRKD